MTACLSKAIERTSALLLIVLSAAASPGCKAKVPTYPTHGRVVYKESGKPVPGGVLIWFESTTPPFHRSVSEVDAEGKFSLGFIHADAGAVEGEHRICFKPIPPILSGTAEQVLATKMHPRYFDFGTSGLKQTVGRGDNELVIEVEGPTEP